MSGHRASRPFQLAVEEDRRPDRFDFLRMQLGRFDGGVPQVDTSSHCAEEPISYRQKSAHRACLQTMGRTRDEPMAHPPPEVTS